MRWQVLSGIVVSGLFAVSPVFADIVDFSTDPQLTTDWTQFPFYSSSANPSGSFGGAWDQTNQNLNLTVSHTEALAGLFKTGETRAAADGVTVTYSNYVGTTPAVDADWTCMGLVVSASATPDLFDGSAWYSIYFQQDFKRGLRFTVNRGLTEVANQTVTSLPSAMHMEVLHDGTDFVFKANGSEIYRDHTYSAASLSHYFMYGGCGAGDTLTVSADNFGIAPVPEPSTIAMLIAGGLGLICYAWRKRK
jgi:hypothetical protein